MEIAVQYQESWTIFWFCFSIKVANQLNIKKENISSASDTIIGNCKPKRANRKRASPIQCDEPQNQTVTSTQGQEEVRVKVETLITEMDTMDSLREKFPKAGPFEFEYLMFLMGSRHH